MLILQVIINQWDKSQRTKKHISDRLNRPNRYPIIMPPAFYAFENRCVIDQHVGDNQDDSLKYSQTTKNNLIFYRFKINLNNNILKYNHSSGTKEKIKKIGSLDNNWIQCRYNWRFSTFKNKMYYWLYEDITLNAICINTLDENVFLNIEPVIIYEDFEFID
jgi:hypothetical protein